MTGSRMITPLAIVVLKHVRGAGLRGINPVGHNNVLILDDKNSVVRADGRRIPRGDMHPMHAAELVVYVGPDGLKILKDRLHGHIGP